MKATELYRALAKELGPWLTERGFKKRRGSPLAFQRVVGGKYHSVWFQCDKRGWDAYTGSRFFVNFSVSDSPALDSVDRREERLNFFLTDAELERARDYRDTVVARIPRPPASYFETLRAHSIKFSKEPAELMAAVRAQFEPESIPYRRHQDFGLRYWQLADIAGWAALIASVLPGAIEQMESWSLPPRATTSETP